MQIALQNCGLHLIMYGTVRLEFPMVSTVIMACCMLYNLAIRLKLGGNKIMLVITPGKKLMISTSLVKFSIHFYSANKLWNNFKMKIFCNFFNIANVFPPWNHSANVGRIFHFFLLPLCLLNFENFYYLYK